MALTAPTESSLSKRRRDNDQEPGASEAVHTDRVGDYVSAKGPGIAGHMRALHRGLDRPARPSVKPRLKRYRERTFRLRPDSIEFLHGFLADYNEALPRTMRLSMDELGRVLVQLFREEELKNEQITSLRQRAS